MNNITLKIAERELDFSFGLGFLGELFEETDLSINEVVEKLNKNPFKMIPTLMYYSSAYALKRQGKEVDFTLYDFTDWIDESGGVGNPNTKIFLNAFTESMTKNIPKTDVDKDASKKK